MENSIQNTSAILDVVTENKDINSLMKEHERRSSLSSSNYTFDNSMVQSPSLESFSTIPDSETISDLNSDGVNLLVKVDNPQKYLDTLETYITFRITTKASRTDFLENEYVVRRRYSDFAWLRLKLVESHPFCIIPPLPGKHSLMGQLDRYSKEFILTRTKLLNNFMSRITSHEILNSNEHYKIFITANQIDFTTYRKQHSPKSNPSIKIYPINNSNSSGEPSHLVIRNQHLEFEKTKDYLDSLSEKLITVEKISSRINKERHDYVSKLNELYPTFAAWATFEPELITLLQNISIATEKNAWALSSMISNYGKAMADPIREFLLYIDVVKESLQRREICQQNYEDCFHDLIKKRTEKDQLLANHDGQRSVTFSVWKQPTYDERLEKLGTHIPQLVKKVESHQDVLECANEALKSDLQRWNLEKQHCLKKILLDFANKQIEYYEKTVSAWENVTSELTFQNSRKTISPSK